MKDLPTQLAAELTGHQGPVRAVRFNKNGNYCLTCGSDKTVKLWNPHRQLLIKSYSGHGLEVLDADASHDNNRIVSAGADKIVQLVDVGTGQIVRKIRGHMARVNCVKFNEESTMVISGSYDATVKAWDLRSRPTDQAVQVMDEAKDSVPSLQLTHHEILTGSVDGCVRRYDIRMGSLLVDNVKHPVTCVSFSHDGHCVLVSTLENKLLLLDKDNGDLLNSVLGQFYSYEGHLSSSYKLDSCVSHTDAYIVSGSEDGKICFWDLVEGHQVHQLQHFGHKEKSSKKITSGEGGAVVYSLSYHPRHPCLLSVGAQGPVKVWKGPEWNNEDEET